MYKKGAKMDSKISADYDFSSISALLNNLDHCELFIHQSPQAFEKKNVMIGKGFLSVSGV